MIRPHFYLYYTKITIRSLYRAGAAVEAAVVPLRRNRMNKDMAVIQWAAVEDASEGAVLCKSLVALTHQLEIPNSQHDL